MKATTKAIEPDHRRLDRVAMVLSAASVPVAMSAARWAPSTASFASTIVAAIKAPVIRLIAFVVASLGDSFSSTMTRSTFSTTTIASSDEEPDREHQAEHRPAC